MQDTLSIECSLPQQIPIRLTPYAKVFYDEWLLSPDSTQYNMVCADQLLQGNLDVSRLRQAIERYIREHWLFNCSIQTLEGIPHWVYHDKFHPLDVHEQELERSALLQYVKQPFDLHRDPLYRFLLMRVDDHTHRLIVVTHHLLMDGISLNQGLFKALSHYYNDPHYQEPVCLAQQRSDLESLQKTTQQTVSQLQDQAKSFWQDTLSEIEPFDGRCLTWEKPTDITPSEDLSNAMREIRFDIRHNKLANYVDRLKKRYAISPFFYGQCVFAMLLHRYTQQEKLTVCYPIAIREGLGWHYGGQVNLNLMPYHFEPGTTMTDLFKQVQLFCDKTLKQSTRYGYLPITDIIQGGEHKDLLDVYFAQAYFRDAPFHFEGIEHVEPLYELIVDGVTPNRLLMELEPYQSGNRLRFRVKYDSQSLDETLLSNFINLYQKLWHEILEDIMCERHRRISDYELLDQQTREHILRFSEGPLLPQRKDQSIQAVFEEQVARFPEYTALVYQGEQTSYHRLNKQANQWAHYLRRKYHIVPDDLIMLCLDKSDLMVTVILGVLKSSAAYVPIADYPQERVDYMVQDVAPQVIVTLQKYRHKFSQAKHVVVWDDEAFQTELQQESINNPPIMVSSEHLAYIIYTSGTTGKPKGVMQMHGNVVDLFVGTNSLYHFSDQDVWVLFHSYVFDFSVWEVFGALLHGGRLIVPTDEETKDGLTFHALCYQEKVTILNQTPTAFYHFMNIAVKHRGERYLSHLKYIIFGGEALNFKALAPWFMVYPDNKPHLINMYGITETTVVMTYRKIGHTDSYKKSYIGHPMPGKSGYVLNLQQQLLPIGAVGELYAKGGVARGYLNKPENTRHSFIPNPFDHQVKKIILYRTGDIVRMLPDGDIEYIGRKDCQVKIRGYRVELSEIEHALNTHSAIKRTVVLLKTTNDSLNQADTYLVAYYIAIKTLNRISIKTHLSKHLPEFMHPHFFIQINEFPRTINGKIDYAALPKPKFQTLQVYLPPSNEVEKLVCEAFMELLDIERIGVNDDFFELGGNSLKAIGLTLMLQKYFDLKVAEIFNLRTPRNIANNKCIENNTLISLLHEVKQLFTNKQHSPIFKNEEEYKQKKAQYYLSIKKINKGPFSSKIIQNVLLTGVTGYLGCNLLYQLLNLTQYRVYLLVRADNDKAAICRVEASFKFYFDQPLQKKYHERIVITCGDIEKNQLGLSDSSYRNLTKTIDSTIHCAALVKHQGPVQSFYSANVEATDRLLAFAHKTRLQDFHYISTCSVAYFGHGIINAQRIFTEDDLPNCSEHWNNMYNKTKYLGELASIRWRQQGVNSTIYRVGNLALMLINGKYPQNVRENSFANSLNFLLKVGCLPETLRYAEISPTDITAQAIVTLFNKHHTKNQTWHVLYPRKIDLLEFLPHLNLISFNDFIDKIIGLLEKGFYDSLFGQFLLRQGWLEKDDLINKMDIEIQQDKTIKVLDRLNFKWPIIHKAVLSDYFSHFIESFKED